ncbi:holo-ACP synthase, malonate decarboxylase-specific [Methylocella silvestris BL2]|uniref:Holo-ACP synthase, malonate decarboxylase-specific n=1 Tax=Methylocella silvestris (strain DSM 15510 / CIP 108128 / LMG 27833 / NCIMB 13906 / BL2) TaxID=395965 RepID=B8EMG7_METSB|nr:malonate decarboxylase holo-[acyl-carrier-protein] synthase [Methylocella silvestris]ACK52095.1 holo-ACP synthase, malonate decarboxylase-specific [Methylocella silvestris BL2]
MPEPVFAWGTPSAPRRHALLQVCPEGFAIALAGFAQAESPAGAPVKIPPIVTEWAARGRPLIARRRGPGDPAGAVPAGLPLPPAFGKLRLALALAPSAIRRIEPPPRLADCVDFAPETWRGAVAAILQLSARLGVEARTFGSLAWSKLTGLAYLGPASDLDLLFILRPQTDVDALLDGLGQIDRQAPVRLDGEFLRPETGHAVNWRELSGGAAEVLVKADDGLALQRREPFLYPDQAALLTQCAS